MILQSTSYYTRILVLAVLTVLLTCAQSETSEKTFKQVQNVFATTVSSEGAGAKVRRIIGSPDLRRLDPFLMLDNFAAKLPGGFPDHPHRGFIATTYMLSGTFYHEDFQGNKGTIGPGDLQWMNAGKGILHSEMPASWEEESVGFQLWINLAAKDKFCDPDYQEIKKELIPKVTKEGTLVKVIAGESLGVKGPIHAMTPTIFLDIEMEPNSRFEQIIPSGWNSFSYVYEGEAFYGPKKEKVATYSYAVFKNDKYELLTIETEDKPAKFIIIGGQPQNEPVVSYGPFVLSNSEDLERTFQDYQFGENGFENAPGWQSKIKNFAKRP